MRVFAENLWNVCGNDAMSRPRSSNRCFASTTIERPSGVSSASDASWATSASSRVSTRGAGWNSFACRSPSVIVPVLSSSSTSTSPAASTARPDVAMTLARIMRSMPAMPIADKQAADRRRDQAHEQRHEHGDGHDGADARRSHRVLRERQQRRRRQQEHDRQRREQDRQRDLVRRAAALRALDHRDHAIEETLALAARDAHDEPVRQHARAARHGREVAAGFAQHGRRLARHGALVDRRDAFDDLAVGRESCR